MVVWIERAALVDAPEIARLNEQAFHYGASVDDTEKLLARILEIPGEVVFVAKTEDGVCGYLHMSDYAATYPPILKDIRTLAVEEAARGMGIGRMLLEAAEVAAREMGAEGIRLVSGWDRTSAHAFYQRCAYKDRKDQKNFIKLFTIRGEDENQ